MKVLADSRLAIAVWFAGLCLINLPSSVALNADEIAQKARETDSPESIVQRMCNYLGGQPQYECMLTAVVSIESPSLSNQMETVTRLRIDRRSPEGVGRPSRVASEMRSGLNGITIVSDGKSVTTYVPSLKKYTIDPTPRTIEEVFDPESSMALMLSGPMGQFTPIGGEAYYATIMKAVTQVSHVGVESVDGVPCDRLSLEQPGFSWDLWITQGDRPLPAKLMMNVPKEATQANPMLKDAKMEFYTRIGSWDFDSEFTDNDFRFDPPTDAVEVSDLFERFGADGQDADVDEELHPLVGERAPPLITKTVDGESFDLSKVSDDEVVILDFWATWCGPCVEALPKLIKVAESFKGQRVRLFAVNVGEDRETINAFLKENEWTVDVLMDEDGEISDQYMANAIPQTVVIGPGRVVQVVHVGLEPNLENKLTKEITAVLGGADLAKEAKEKLAKSLAEGAETQGLERRWEIRGRCESVAANPDGSEVYLLRQNGTVDGYAASEDRQTMSKTTTVPVSNGLVLRLARLQATDPQGDSSKFDLVTFDRWGGSVVATSSNGEMLWEHIGGDGVDDVWPADMDGDHVDEVVVGYNGGTGIRVLDSDGEIIWKNQEIGNVWHVDAIDLDQDGQLEAVSTSARGAVHVFAQDGTLMRTMKVSLYGNMIRALAATQDRQPMICVAGSADEGERLVMIDGDGAEQFSLGLPDDGVQHVDSMEVHAESGWVAVAMRGGIVHVVDCSKGKIIATAKQSTRTTDIAWQSRPQESPLLVIKWNVSVDAYEVTPTP